MSNIDFPNSPNNGDTYTFDSKLWTYDGEKWETSGGSKGQKGEVGPGGGEKGAVGSQGATGPTGGKGEKGEVGLQGSTGPASSVAGPTGPQGVAGGTFVGARYTPSANVATTTAGFDGTISSTVAVPIDVQVYDTNSIVSANTITIPNGVTYAEIFAHTRLENGSENSPRTHIFKGTTLIKTEWDSSTGASETRGTDITTGIIPVSAGDTFTVRISSASTGIRLDTSNSYVGLHATVTGTTAQGDKGQKGDDSSVPGPTGADSTVAGPTGAKGEKGEASTVVGPAGPQGTAGATGPAGDKGDTGATGPQGAKGEASTVAGPQGPAGGTFVGASASPSAQLDTTATYQTVALNSANYDTSSFISGNAFVIPASSSISYIEINADLESIQRASYYPTGIRIQKNGSTILEDLLTTNPSGRNLRLNTGVIPATANDSFVVQARGGGNDGAVGTNSTISIHATVTGTTAQGDKGDKGDTGAGGSQTLTLNGTAGQLAISGGNNVDLRQTQYLYSSTSDLPSASTYHGAIAHVHAEGALYFAHGGSWVKLANDSTAVSSSSETTFTADVKFDTGVEEKFHTYSSSSGVTSFDCNNGHVHYVTSPSGDITANFTNLGLTAEYTTNLTVVINQGATAREVTAVQIGGSGQTINWQGGSAPTGTSNGIDAFSFTILNDGGSYVVLGQMVDFT